MTKYQYDPLGRLISVTDCNDVELLSFRYDVLGNVTHMASTNAIYEYTYDPLNRVTNVLCMLTNIPGFSTVRYKIAYAYDPAGNLTNRLITGLEGFGDTITTRYQYDEMNRLTNVVQLINGAVTASATNIYDAAGRLYQKCYGNRDIAWHFYDIESRLQALAIGNPLLGSGGGVTWWHYGWDAAGNILAITNFNTNVTLYAYDAVSQLTNEVQFTIGLPGSTTNAWQYDEAGNWITSPGEGLWRVYNADNELVGVGTNPALPTVRGYVEPGPNSNKWYNSWAECRGVRGRVNPQDGTFALPNVPLEPGENELVVTVTDVSGNQHQQSRTVIKLGDTERSQVLRYDGNGNLTNWVIATENWVYEWDWADRLVRVKSNNVVVLQNWYDGQSRRIAKQELVNGQTVKTLYLYDGWDIVAVMNGQGQLLESYTRGVGLAGDIGTLVAVTHHTGPSAGTYYTHCNHRGDVILVRSGTTTVTAYDYSAFGNLGTVIGQDLCRFKFSSKERDPSTGFYYYGYRFYAPLWQRWISRDPIGETSGDNNLFAFVRNNPIEQVDKYGESTVGKSSPASKPGPSKKPLSNPYRSGPNCQQWCKDKSEDMCAACCWEQFALDEMLNPAAGIANLRRRENCVLMCFASEGKRGPR